MKLRPTTGILILLLTFIWCILNETFNLPTLVIGLLVSFVTLLLLRIIQPDSNKNYTYRISVFRLCLFLIVLLKDIYVSAIKTIIHLLKNEINPQFVTTSTLIKRPWLQALIGNAITLTPGTVTVHLNKGDYTVLWLYPLSIRHKEIKRQLIQNFEDILIKED